MNRISRSIAQQLLDAELAINNTLASPTILAAVGTYGYTATRMQTAKALFQEALELTEKQKKEYGDQYEATAGVQRAWDEAAVAYAASLKIARIAFRGNNAARNALGLEGIRKQSLSGWLSEARRFYNNMLRDAELMAAMETFNYTEAKFEAEAALVEGVAAASELQHRERGVAQETTKLRDEKLDALMQWLADFKAIAEIALADSPQQLEQLGWVVGP